MTNKLKKYVAGCKSENLLDLQKKEYAKKKKYISPRKGKKLVKFYAKK